jgi:hypothetical protein
MKLALMYYNKDNENFEGAELAEMKNSAILFEELLLAKKTVCN